MTSCHWARHTLEMGIVFAGESRREYLVFHFVISAQCAFCANPILRSRSLLFAHKDIVRHTNSFNGSSVTSWLSSSSLSALGGQDSMSAAAWSLLGTCLIQRL